MMRPAVDAQLNAVDWCSAGPGETSDLERPVQVRAVQRPGDHGARLDGTKRKAVDHVAVFLKEARERRVEKRDPLEPLHRSHSIPARHDQPKRTAVLAWDRVSLHEVCDEHVIAERFVDRQGALVADLSSEVLRHAPIGTAKKQLDGSGRDFDLTEDISE